jgi:hypothetical protein
MGSDQLERLGIERNETSVGDSRPKRHVCIAAVRRVLLADRADILEPIGHLPENRILGDDEAAPELELPCLDIDDDLDELAVALDLRIADDGDDRLTPIAVSALSLHQVHHQL